MKLNFGCAKADVTPSFPVFMRGYGARNELSDGVEEPIELGVLVLKQGRKSMLVITVDSLGIELDICERIYKDLEVATGFGASNTYLCCSHTHFAPGFSPYYVCHPDGKIPLGLYPAEAEYYTLFVSALVSAVKEAQAAMEEVEVEEVAIPLNELLFNRRTVDKATGKVVTNYVYPTPEFDDKLDILPVDPELMVWRFRGKDGIKAILGRFSCHPVTGGSRFYAISADYPGYFKAYVQELFGCPGFFMLGNAGDAVPMQRNGESRSDIGRIMATSIRLAERRFRKAGDFKLDSAVVQVPMKLRVKCSRSKADALWEKELKAARAAKSYRRELELFHYAHANMKAYPEDTVAMPLRVMRLGSKVLVGMPFEVLTEIGTRLRKACPNTILTSITGGYEGYLPLAKDFPKGGYEADQGAMFQKNAGNLMLAAAIKAVKDLK